MNFDTIIANIKIKDIICMRVIHWRRKSFRSPGDTDRQHAAVAKREKASGFVAVQTAMRRPIRFPVPKSAKARSVSQSPSVLVCRVSLSKNIIIIEANCPQPDSGVSTFLSLSYSHLKAINSKREVEPPPSSSTNHRVQTGSTQSS